MKKIIILFLCALLFFGVADTVFAEEMKTEETLAQSQAEMDITAKSAVLMEAQTGEILYEKNSAEALSPASVTKIMTLLLIMEAIEKGVMNYSDNVTVSQNAASMGGSQVFLKEGETFTLEELLKCAVIASANDAAVALAEYHSGSEKLFVDKMNERAKELGLLNSIFENVTGLDDDTENHKMSAIDVAVITRELLKYPKLFTYSSMWQDSIRDGAFVLTNTNRLVRFYEGCTGLKTGSTDKAGYCVTVTAKRGNLTLISVIMGAETRDTRNAEARELLDYGFSSYELFTVDDSFLENVEIHGGIDISAQVYQSPFSVIVPKGKTVAVEFRYDIPRNLTAPLENGETVGKIDFYLDGEKIGETALTVHKDYAKIGFLKIWFKIFQNIVVGKER